MTVGPGSVAPPMQGQRRSTRSGRGSNGRDVQLDKLGDVLTAPTRQARKRFAPAEGLVLPNNDLAPVPKRRRATKKVCPTVSPLLILTEPKATLPPPPTSPPCVDAEMEPLPHIDPRLGFLPPQPPATLLSISPRCEAASQLPSVSQTPRYRSLQPSATPPPAHLPLACLPLSSADSTPDLSDSDSDASNNGDGQGHYSNIDEHSDDEDDRAAHELLRAAPVVVQDPANPSAILPYGYQGFAVGQR